MQLVEQLQFIGRCQLQESLNRQDRASGAIISLYYSGKVESSVPGIQARLDPAIEPAACFG
jgi:hypothetical protein